MSFAPKQLFAEFVKFTKYEIQMKREAHFFNTLIFSFCDKTGT